MRKKWQNGNGSCNAPANPETEAVEENVSEETEMPPADASNTSEVEAVVEEEVAEMEMAPADAPANPETEAVQTCQRKRKCPLLMPRIPPKSKREGATNGGNEKMAPTAAPANSETEAEDRLTDRSNRKVPC